MAAPVLNVDTNQGTGMALSGFNQGVVNGVIADATISGANTYATLYARVLANIPTDPIDEQQSDNMVVLRSLKLGNALGILTDTNLNSLTTVAAVRALFTATNPALPATYMGDNIS